MDKTGTLTTNKIEVVHLYSAEDTELPEEELAKVKAFAYGLKDANKTIEALKIYFTTIKDGLHMPRIIGERPFNSKDKYSGVMFDTGEIYFLGAPEIFMLYKNNNSELRNKVKPYFEKGLRCLFIMKYTKEAHAEVLQNKNALADTQLVSLIVLKDTVREDVIETIRELHNRKMELKILSGDNEESVAAIARMVNISKIKPISGISLDEMGPEEFEAAALKYTIFGRVTPEHKQRIIESLQKHHRTTAMIGDGVNDVLAIKKADLGIAMNSGVQMAKDSADIVLLDNTFKSLPRVMRQGEEIYTNIVKVAKLFITKSIYSGSLIILTGYLALEFPFLPRQTTLISLITVGIPAIFIALIPTTTKQRANFSSSVLSFSIAAGITYTLSSLLTYIVLYLMPSSHGAESVIRERTGVAIALILGGLMTASIVILDEDYSLKNIYKNLASLAIIMLTCVIFFLIMNSETLRYFFDITTMTFYEWMTTMGIFLIATTIFLFQRKFRFIWSE
jgi:cation-transporting ATPase E